MDAKKRDDTDMMPRFTVRLCEEKKRKISSELHFNWKAQSSSSRTLPNAEFFIKIYSEGFLFIPSNFCALPLYLPHAALILFIIIHKLPSGSNWKASRMKTKDFQTFMYLFKTPLLWC